MTEEAPKNEKSKARKSGLKSFLGGNLLASEQVMKQMPFVFFVVFLGILLITNRYWAEKTMRQIEVAQDSIKELKAESITFETELMRMNRPSEITNKVKDSGLNLVEPQEPARKIKVKKSDRD
ncbi:FtsL-like putative cell division protein [Gaoshiqia sp. Z1-71]|uniref:FtsL-like putative cell division protein n=1 Tax=Gaoshiqia hydrogeniformans TaxID=3290090 RepID=UPI003BF84477